MKENLSLITEEEVNASAVTSAPTVLNGTPYENKYVFDKLSKEVIIPIVNSLISSHLEVEEKVNTNSEDISVNKGKISVLETRVNTNSEDISVNEGKIAELETKVNTNSEDISVNKGKISVLQTKISTNTEDISVNEGKIAELETKVNANTEDISVNKGKIAQLETKVNTNSEDISVNKGKIAELTEDYVSKKQGTANAGKALVVGADGKITLADINGSYSDIIGEVGDNNIITLAGNLADGTYVFKYENANGSYTDIGTLVVGELVQYSITVNNTNCTSLLENPKVINADGSATLVFVANGGYALPEEISVSGASYLWDMETGTLTLSNPETDVIVTISGIVDTPYTNVLLTAQEYASSSPYVGANGTVGYGENMRISSSSPSATYMKSASGVDTTGLIPVKKGDVLRFKNCNFKVTPTNTQYGTMVFGFDENKAHIQKFGLTSAAIQNRILTVVENGEYVQITLEPTDAWISYNFEDSQCVNELAYIMISTDNLDEASVITINEEITE